MAPLSPTDGAPVRSSTPGGQKARGRRAVLYSRVRPALGVSLRGTPIAGPRRSIAKDDPQAEKLLIALVDDPQIDRPGTAPCSPSSSGGFAAALPKLEAAATRRSRGRSRLAITARPGSTSPEGQARSPPRSTSDSNSPRRVADLERQAADLELQAKEMRNRAEALKLRSERVKLSARSRRRDAGRIGSIGSRRLNAQAAETEKKTSQIDSATPLGDRRARQVCADRLGESFESLPAARSVCFFGRLAAFSFILGSTSDILFPTRAGDPSIGGRRRAPAPG